MKSAKLQLKSGHNTDYEKNEKPQNNE